MIHSGVSFSKQLFCVPDSLPSKTRRLPCSEVKKDVLCARGKPFCTSSDWINTRGAAMLMHGGGAHKHEGESVTYFK